MPNKKTKTVKIRHLECFSAIYGELAQNPEYAGYEIEEAVLQVNSPRRQRRGQGDRENKVQPCHP